MPKSLTIANQIRTILTFMLGALFGTPVLADHAYDFLAWVPTLRDRSLAGTEEAALITDPLFHGGKIRWTHVHHLRLIQRFFAQLRFLYFFEFWICDQSPPILFGLLTTLV